MKTVGQFGQCGIALALAACGGASDVPPKISIAGSVQAWAAAGPTPVTDAFVGAYDVVNSGSPVAMSTSDSAGNYLLAVPTGGKQFDGYILATKTGYLDGYLVLPPALTGGFTIADVNTTMMLAALGSVCNVTPMGGSGTVFVEILDRARHPLVGGKVTSSPTVVATCYVKGGAPDKTATETDTAGLGLLFNVPGDVTVSATANGGPFSMTDVNTRVDAVTTAYVTE